MGESAFNVPGAAPFHLVSANTTNRTVLKAGPGTLKSLIGINIDTAAPCYVKFFDQATSPAPSTDSANIVHVIPIPTAGTADGAVTQLSLPDGLQFKVGIAFVIVTGITDTDETAPAADKVVISGSYN